MKQTASPSWSLVVSSCDAYCDLWPFFFHFLFKHWPAADTPHPIQLISNRNNYDDQRVLSLDVGPDRSWGENLESALKRVDTTYVIFLLDDFFLDQNVSGNWIETLVSQLDKLNADYASLYMEGTEGPNTPETWFRGIPHQMQCPGFHAALWRKSYLQHLASQHLNIWQTEKFMRDEITAGKQGLYNLSSLSPQRLTYVESVRGCFWKEAGLRYCREHGFQVDLSTRPFPPVGRDLFSKMLRSFYKRRMQWRVSRASRGEILSIKPLRSENS